MGSENKYIVHICRDTEMMKRFVKFSNRVHHPRVSMHLFIIGAALLAMPVISGGGKLAGIIICVVGGGFLVFMSLFRHYIAVARMKKSQEIKLNEELIYIFGNTGVRVEQDGVFENMGSYKKIYRVWEDERCYYVGMNEEDLLILPKTNFEEGDEKSFKDFILEKSKADYTWQPVTIVNICKNKLMKWKQMEAEQRANLNANRKKK